MKIRHYNNVGFFCSEGHMNILAIFGKRRLSAMAEEQRASEKESPDAVISGYFGYGNSGDDTSLFCLISAIQNEYSGARLAVLCRRTGDFAKWCGAVGIGRYNIFRMISSLRRSRLLISGGGSLFQNSTSIRSLLYYVSVIVLARLCGAGVVICANGIGPLRGKFAEGLVMRAALMAEYISVRDTASLEYLVKLGVPRERVALTADPAFRLALGDMSRRAHTRRIFGMREGVRYFAVALRASACHGDGGRCICRACRDICLRFGIVPVFVSMQDSEDGELCRIIAENTCGEALSVPYLTGNELCRLVGETEFVLSMRLHLMIYAATAGVPSVGISVDPKIDAAANILGECAVVRLCELSGDKLCSAVTRALSADRGKLSEITRSKAALAGEDISRITRIMRDKKQYSNIIRTK